MSHHRGGLGLARGIGPRRTASGDVRAIGLDIGATAVRAELLSPGTGPGGTPVVLHGGGQVALPAGAVLNGVVVDEATVTAALKELWRTNRLAGHAVVVGLTNQQVLVRDLQMPVLPPDQLARALPFRAREVIALPLDQALIDFVPLGTPDSEGMQEGLLVAAPREPVLAMVRAVERAGLRVNRVDLSSFAVLRAIARPEAEAEAVIDLGAHLTSIVMHQRGVPRVVRTVTQGGATITARLAERLELGLADAEQLKCEQGLTGSNPEAVSLITGSLRPLLAEIRSSVQYFASMTKGAEVEQVSLTGGAAALAGLPEALAEATGVPVALVEPLERLPHERPSASGRHRYVACSSAVAAGLALGVGR